MTGSEFTILPYGDQGVLVQCRDLKSAMALRGWLEMHPVVGQREIIPAARTVLIRLDGGSDPSALAGQLPSPELLVQAEPEIPVPAITIEVIYDGPDLAQVADFTGLAVRDIIRLHTTSPWVVAFTGFMPGFGYLTGGDPRLAVPRRHDPRPRVPAGAVGLAGEFSGVYPQSSPGGWQLLGRTDAVLWDERRNPPALFVPGTTVHFVQVLP